jgi:hypothetical protein
MQFTLNSASRATINRVVGLTTEEISDMDIGELQSKIEEKIGKPLVYSKKCDERSRFFTFNHKEMNDYIDSINPL